MGCTAVHNRLQLPEQEEDLPMEDQKAILKRASKIAFKKLAEVDRDARRLEEPFRTVAVVYAAQGVIDNGGFFYFFASDWPGNPPYSLFVDAYRRIGSEGAADAIDHAAKSFGIPSPETNSDFRNSFMDRHFLNADTEGDSAVEWNDCVCGDKQVWANLATWIQEHGSAFAALDDRENGPLLRQLDYIQSLLPIAMKDADANTFSHLATFDGYQRYEGNAIWILQTKDYYELLLDTESSRFVGLRLPPTERFTLSTAKSFGPKPMSCHHTGCWHTSLMIGRRPPSKWLTKIAIRLGHSQSATF